MNILLLDPDDLWSHDGSVTLRDHRANHIRTVLKSKVGDTLRVGLLGGDRGEGLITAMDADVVTLFVRLDHAPPARHRFELVLALPRPKMLRRILRTVAEFGVGHLHLINSARVEKSYWQSPLLSTEKVAEALQTGLERSQDTVAPKVSQHRLFRPFVEDQLIDLCAGRPCWITEIGASRSLMDTPAEPAVVMIGPEGGFVPFELALVESAGAHPVNLGRRTLSVDTALTAVLAQGMAINS